MSEATKAAVSYNYQTCCDLKIEMSFVFSVLILGTKRNRKKTFYILKLKL